MAAPISGTVLTVCCRRHTRMSRRHPPPARRPFKESQCLHEDAGFSFWAAYLVSGMTDNCQERDERQSSIPTARRSPVVPSNPVPEGARAGYFDDHRQGAAALRDLPQDRRRRRRARSASCRGAPSSSRSTSRRSPISRRAALPSRPSTGAGRAARQRLIGNKRLGYVDATSTTTGPTSRASTATILLPDCPPPYYLVGHSMGGLVSLYAGYARPHDVRAHLPVAPRWWRSTGSRSASPAWRRSAETLSFLGLGQLPVGRRADKPPSRAELSRAIR